MISTRPTSLDSTVGVLPHLRPRPRPARYEAPWSLVLFIADFLGVWAALSATQVLFHENLSRIVGQPEALVTVIFAVAVWIWLFERIGMYSRSFAVSARDEIYASIAASGMAMAPALGIFLLAPSLEAFRHPLIATLLFAAVGVSLTRFAAHLVRANTLGRGVRRVAVVGSPERVLAVPLELSLTASDVVVRFPIDAFEDELAELGSDDELAGLEWLTSAFERGCDEIIVTDSVPAELVPGLLRLTESQGVKLAFAPMRIRPHACDFSVRRDGGLALFYPRSLAICTLGAEAFRRFFDLVISVPALVLLSPVMALVSLAVFFDSGLPILYRQTRVGRLGKHFDILKFRTMRRDAEADSGPVWAQADEPRTTHIGRFLRRTSLDELPQLINVVRGDMSIVGPRPERPFYVEQFRKMLPRYDERHLVRPGITGWSHVNMQRNVDTSAIGERLSYDLFYLEHWSVFMDILIICKTGAEFLFHTAA